MAYEPTVWENREVERPRTYIMTENPDGTVTLTPSEGQVFAAGTPIDATNLNKIEQQIASNTENIDNKVDKTGGEIQGTLTATVLNASEAVQEGGTPLGDKYQPKGNYAPTGDYVTWNYDPNGVYLNIGTANGKNYSVWFTAFQPSAGGANERRIWIQTDV